MNSISGEQCNLLSNSVDAHKLTLNRWFASLQIHLNADGVSFWQRGNDALHIRDMFIGPPLWIFMCD